MSCGICGKPIKPELEINAPDSTFNPKGSITLKIAECKNCGLVQLVDVPLSPDYEVSNKSIGLSSEYRAVKEARLREFVNRYDLSKKSLAEVGCGNGEYLDILIGVGAEGVVGYGNLFLSIII